jgi:hypothetical protein
MLLVTLFAASSSGRKVAFFKGLFEGWSTVLSFFQVLSDALGVNAPHALLFSS